MKPFRGFKSINLTSTTSSQSVTIPPGADSMVIYNAAANPVFLKFAASVAIPGAAFADGVFVVAPGTTQTFDLDRQEGDLAYIAATAGGALYITLGKGL